MIRLRLLGETAIDIDGTPVGPDSQVIFAVLLVLSLERGKRLGRTALHRLLWPAADDESGRHNLRQVAYKLRQLGVPLDATQSSLMLPASAVEGELVELLSGTGAVGARLLAGRRVGELLPGYAPSFSAPFADWVDEQRGLLQSGLRRALLSAMAEARSAGRWREVEAIAREVLRFDPLNEEATLALAEATALAGSKAQAIDIIDRYLGEVGGRPGDLQISASVLRRRIAERFPVHRYVSAAERFFVGRATEMAELLRGWQQAKDGRGAAIMLWGEPGIGKSRLAHELGKATLLQGAQVQRAASRSWDLERPLGAIVDLVPGLRQLPGGAGIDPDCGAFLDRLTTHNKEGTAIDGIDLVHSNRGVHQAVFDLIEAVLVESPLVLLFEDVQWLDPGSWLFIAELLRFARRQRLLVVLTSREARPAGMPASDSWEALRRIRLGGLGTESCGELLDAITVEAGKYMDVEHREWCLPLAGGNPLFIQEIALQWLEKGSIRIAPRTLRAMVEARVESLTQISFRILHTLAIGEDGVTLQLLTAALSLSPTEVLSAVDDLAAKELIVERLDSFQVRHDVIAEVVLEQTQRLSTVLLHSRLAAAIERLAQHDASPRLYWRCYKHWLQAGDESGATRALGSFASYLLGAGRARECIDMLAQAETSLTGAEARAAIAGMRLRSYVILGRWQLAIQAASTPEAIARGGADTLLSICEARWQLNGDMKVLADEAGRLAKSPVLDVTTRVRAAAWTQIFCDNATELTEHEVVACVVEPLLDSPEAHPAFANHYRAIRSCRLRAFDRATSAAVALCRDAMRLPSLGERARLLRHAGAVLLVAGDAVLAHEAVLAAVQVCELSDAAPQLVHCFLALAEISFYRAEARNAAEWILRAEQAAQQVDEGFLLAHIHFGHLQVAVIQGDVPMAKSSLAVLGPPCADDGNSSRKLSQLAAHLRVAAMCDSYWSQEAHDLMQTAISVIDQRANYYAADFLASAVVVSLQREGRQADALSFVHRYLRNGRPRRGPLHMDLAASVSRLTAESAAMTTVAASELREGGARSGMPK